MTERTDREDGVPSGMHAGPSGAGQRRRDADAGRAAQARTAARRLEAAVPRDVEAGDAQAFERAAAEVLPVARAASAAGAPPDPALLAAARIAARRALMGDARGSLEILEPAAALAEEAELEEPFLAAVLAEQLASALQDAGHDADAVAAAARAEALGRRACGPGDPRLATLLANVGTVHKRRGDFLTAEVHFRRALEELDRAAERGPGRAGVPATALASLSGPICLSLCDVLRAQGKPEEAVPPAERAVRESQAALGPMHRATVDALESLALALDEAGESGTARTLWKRVWAAYAWNLGDDHPLTRAARERAES